TAPDAPQEHLFLPEAPDGHGLPGPRRPRVASSPDHRAHPRPGASPAGRGAGGNECGRAEGRLVATRRLTGLVLAVVTVVTGGCGAGSASRTQHRAPRPPDPATTVPTTTPSTSLVPSAVPTTVPAPV